ncbi:MAG: hydroxyethylthiazole kinase [Synergistes sp.]|nr:hydroxyethylthiazole kinase [Synergistes sp.]
MFGKYLVRVRDRMPLIHNITNYVTANDTANILLACGARPIMSDEPDEAEDITSICSGLVINIGTLNKMTIEAMFRAGKRANELGNPVVLDPVGAGASRLRTETGMMLMEKIKPTAVRGNMSEIKSLAFACGSTKGVDADIDDLATEENLERSIQFVTDFARQNNVITAATGAIDLVSDGRKCFVIRGGAAEMGGVTGIGCQLSAMMTAFLAASVSEPLEAAAASVALMGLAGEIGLSNMADNEGNASYRNRIIDAVWNMTDEILTEGEKFEIYER